MKVDTEAEAQQTSQYKTLLNKQHAYKHSSENTTE